MDGENPEKYAIRLMKKAMAGRMMGEMLRADSDPQIKRPGHMLECRANRIIQYLEKFDAETDPTIQEYCLKQAEQQWEYFGRICHQRFRARLYPEQQLCSECLLPSDSGDRCEPCREMEYAERLNSGIQYTLPVG